MLSDVWPVFGLSLTTERLVLRLPREEELAALAELAGRGVHDPEERPFLTPWTEGGPTDRARSVLQGQWSQLADWGTDSWRLGLGVFSAAAEPLGMVTLRADDFSVLREVSTSSWLGLEHHGQGLGTESRIALLALAFDHLDAVAALSEVFTDNHASQSVSRRLGYEHDGISRDRRGDEALVSDRLRLTRETWAARAHDPVEVVGLAACRAMFG